MEEKMNQIPEIELENVSGGAGSAKKHVQIVNCKVRCNVRSSAHSTPDDNRIGYANLGDRYVYYGSTGDWAKVQYGSVKAFINKKFIKVLA